MSQLPPATLAHSARACPRVAIIEKLFRFAREKSIICYSLILRGRVPELPSLKSLSSEIDSVPIYFLEEAR